MSDLDVLDRAVSVEPAAESSSEEGAILRRLWLEACPPSGRPPAVAPPKRDLEPERRERVRFNLD